MANRVLPALSRMSVGLSSEVSFCGREIVVSGQYTKHRMPRNGRFEATRIIRREGRDCNIVTVTQNDARVAGEQARQRSTRAASSQNRI